MTTSASSSATLTHAVPRRRGFALTFLVIEIRRKLRNRRTLFFTLLFPIVMFLLIGLGYRDVALSSTPVAEGGISVAAFIMVSMALYGAMMSATAAGGAVAAERMQGWSRQLRLTPLTPLANVTAKVCAGLVLGLVAVAGTFITGALAGVNMPLTAWLVSGLAAWLLGTLVFTALGLLVGYMVPSENATQFVNIAVVLLSFLGGLFTPLDAMPDLLQNIAMYSPVYGISELAHAPLTGDEFNLGALVNAVVWLVIFASGTVLLFRRDTKRA